MFYRILPIAVLRIECRVQRRRRETVGVSTAMILVRDDDRSAEGVRKA